MSTGIYDGRDGHPGNLSVVGNSAPVPTTANRYGEAPESDEYAIELRALVQIIFKRKWMIMSLLIIGLTAGYLSTLLVPPLYRAKATIEIAKHAAQVLSESSVTPQVQADPEFVETQSALLKSRELAQRVVEQLNLDQDPVYADQTLPQQDRVHAATQYLSQNLRVNVEGLSRLIAVRVSSPDPEDAARITNTLVENFIQTSLERKYNTTAYARHFVEDRLESARLSLEDSESLLARYAAEQGLVNFGGNSSIFSLDGETIVTLNKELATAESERIAAYQKYIKAENSPITLDVLDSPDLKKLREQRFQLDTEYQNKLEIYRPEYSEMTELKRRIELTDREIEAERTRIVDALETSFRAAEAKEASLRERIGELKTKLIELRTQSVQYGILERQVETNRSQYDALLTRLKELTTAEGIGASQASVVDRAIAPTHPFQPSLGKHLLLATILSLAAGIGLAILWEYIDDTIRVPEQLISKLGLPIIGIVPVASKSSDLVQDMMKNPKDSLAEGYFSIRANLLFSTNSGAPRCLSLTSASQAEGKSTCAVGLGLAFSRSGQRALVIDADMRRPSFVVDRNLSIGLSGLLASDADAMEHIIAGPTENLFLLPAGRIPPNPAELLSGHRLNEILEQLKQVFDIVIVDCPPVLGFADAPLLAAACDATVVVISSGKSRRITIRRSLDRLVSTHAQTVGAILTKFDARKVGYDYGYYYYNYGPGAYDYARPSARTERQSRKITLFKDQLDD